MAFTAKIIDPIGIHARPASVLVATASAFSSQITLEVNGRKADVKSIMNLMALGVKSGDEVVFTAEGADAEEALAAVEKVMKDNKLI